MKTKLSGLEIGGFCKRNFMETVIYRVVDTGWVLDEWNRMNRKAQLVRVGEIFRGEFTPFLGKTTPKWHQVGDYSWFKPCKLV
jgi:hypothetical protein